MITRQRATGEASADPEGDLRAPASFEEDCAVNLTACSCGKVPVSDGGRSVCLQWMVSCVCGRFVLAENQAEAEGRWKAGESDA